MHGLINRSIQSFVSDTYGAPVWEEVSTAADLPPEGFEPMLIYDDTVTDSLLTQVSATLDKPEAALLEDLGTYLVSHPSGRGVRRLLRFSGETFADFLYALDDLPSRARLAMPDLEMPDLELREEAGGQFRLFVCSMHRGWGFVMMGLLRAMADDYGALVMMEMAPGASSIAVIEIRLLDSRYAEGRSFSLADTGWDGAEDAPEAGDVGDEEDAGEEAAAAPARGIG